MAKIVLAWELGGGLGHIAKLVLVGQELARRGHKVTAAVRDLVHADQVFQGTGIAYFQAPTKVSACKTRFNPPETFAHILHNCGFSTAAELRGMASAWKALYEALSPDIILADHSPTALLAARGASAKVVQFGTGFCSPPDRYPLPQLRRSKTRTDQQLLEDENHLLQVVNEVLQSFGQHHLQRVSQLYGDTDDNILTTFPELDHFGARENQRYWGPLPSNLGRAPLWPKGKGPKVLAYLKSFPALPAVLNALRQLGCPTILVTDGVDPALLQQFRADNLKVEESTVDADKVARECEFAILNAGHGMTATVLLAGKPSLQIPIYIEQYLLAKAVDRLGAALVAPSNNSSAVVSQLKALLSSTVYLGKAQEFASRYQDFRPQTVVSQIADRLEQLGASNCKGLL